MNSINSWLIQLIEEGVRHKLWQKCGKRATLSHMAMTFEAGWFEKYFFSISVFESKYKVSIVLMENSSRFNPFKILMRNDLSTLSNALENSTYTAHQPRLANRSRVIAFFNFRIAVCICLSRKYACWGFFRILQKSFLNSITDNMGKKFRVSIHETDRVKILYCYGIFRFREQFDYCWMKTIWLFSTMNKMIENFR